MLYLDHNATTPLAPVALEAMTRVWSDVVGNPSSPHRCGQRAAAELRSLSDRFLARVGARIASFPADRLVLTSGGTEANHLALHGLGATEPGSLVVSAIEHPSIRRAAIAAAERFGHRLIVVAPDRYGVVRPESVAARLDETTRLVSIMAANNETGVIQPIAEIGALCRAAGVPCHTDAVQAIGKVPVSFADTEVTAMTVAPHKFHGPVGIGALVLRSDATLRPAMIGGFQQQELRPGTEPLALLAGAVAALEWYLDSAETFRESVRGLRDAFERTLLTEGSDLGAAAPQIIGSEVDRLPQTSCVAFPGIDRQALVMAADMAGVACGTGSACASGSSRPSETLAAMGLPDPWIAGAVRFGFGVFQSPSDAPRAAHLILNAVKHLR